MRQGGHMLQIANGISTALLVGGNPVEISDNGRVLETLEGRGKVKIQIDVQNELAGKVFGFTLQIVGEDKEVELLRRALLKKECRFTRQVPIVARVSGYQYTQYPTNLAFVAQVELTGEVLVHRVALVSNQGKMFFLHEIEYAGQGYSRNELLGILFPGLEYWPELAGELGRVLRTNSINLPVAKNIPALLRSTPEGLKEDEGRVVWYNSAMGMGVVVTPMITARVRKENIVCANGDFPRLKSGQVIRFESLQDNDLVTSEERVTKDNKPRRKTSLGWDLIGVEILS